MSECNESKYLPFTDVSKTESHVLKTLMKLGSEKIVPNETNIGSDTSPVYGVTGKDKPGSILHTRINKAGHRNSFLVELLNNKTAYIVSKTPLKYAIELRGITETYAKKLVGEVAKDCGVLLKYVDGALKTAAFPIEDLTENLYAIVKAEYEILSEISKGRLKHQAAKPLKYDEEW